MCNISVCVIHTQSVCSSGSSSWVRGAEKHEIYVTAFGSHLFYDLFSQSWGGMAPLAPWICYWCERLSVMQGLPEFGMAWQNFFSFYQEYPILDSSRIPHPRNGNLVRRSGLGILSFDYSTIPPPPEMEIQTLSFNYRISPPN